jgi:hypothetical protein
MKPNPEPTDAERLARYGGSLGFKVHVYPGSPTNGGIVVVTLRDTGGWVESLRSDEKHWYPVAMAYLDGEAERQAEARAIGMEGV